MPYMPHRLPEHYETETDFPKTLNGIDISSRRLESIAQEVSTIYDIPIEVLKSKRRTRRVVGARQLIMYAARKQTDLSLTEIGEYFGGRDHSTVSHACQVVQKRLQENPELRMAAARLDVNGQS